MRVKFFIFLLVLIFSGFSFWLVQRPTPYTAFLSETYDTIKTNYWQKIEDQALIDLYLAAARVVAKQPQLVTAKDKKDLFNQLGKIVKD